MQRKSGAHWFVGYCRAGNTWDFQAKLIVADDADVEITIEADHPQKILVTL